MPPHESPIVERVRLAVTKLMSRYGVTQRAIANRLGIAASSINGFLQGKQSLELRHLDGLAERLGVTAAELVAHTHGLAIYELTDKEAQIMRTFRRLPVDVRDDVWSLVQFLTNLLPEDERLSQLVNHWNRMDEGEKRHFLHLAVYLRDTGLPPDVRVGLGLPAATPKKPPRADAHGARPPRTRGDAT